MEFINQTIKKILPPDAAAIKTVKTELERRKLSGNLGYLENILLKYAGITRSAKLAIPKKKTIVVCADHGVAKMGVSAYPPETTVEMTRNYLITKGAVANALSNFAGSNLSVVDMGIGADTHDITGLIDKKIALGTKNIAEGAAMSREDAITAIKTGIELANKYADEGFRCFLPGEMGIANTTASAAIVAACGNLTPFEATGRGTNISDERLKLKISVVAKALAVNKPDPNDGIDILAKIGGFEFGCIAGIMLGAAARQSPTMLDGFNTGAAALIARALCPQITDYLIGSHLAAEKAHRTMLYLLNLKPYMDMNFRLGEATGSSIAINLLDGAIKLFNSAKKEILPEEHLAKDSAPHKVLPASQSIMADCSLYIDNLAKPIHSMGRLEEFAIQMAGITKTKQPKHIKKALLHLTTQKANVPQTTICFAAHADAALYPVLLPQDEKTAALELAALAQSLAEYKIIGFASDSESDKKIITAAIKAACPVIAANNSAIVAGGSTTFDGIAAALDENPLLKDYIFPPLATHSQKGNDLLKKLNKAACLDLGTDLKDGIAAALTMKIIDASLNMLNDMKTFGTAGVSVANDGPGANRQNLAIK